MGRTVTISVNTSVLKKTEREILAKTKSVAAPLKAWAVETGKDIALSWNKMTFGHLYSVTGFMASKEFRPGIKWRGVRPMYGRLTDGAVIPPWGGTPRLDGAGQVKGRKRPSGKRVTQDSLVGSDTNKMRREFTGRAVLEADTATRRLSVKLVTNRKYAAYQNRLRPFNKPTQGDRDRLVRIMREWLAKIAEAINARKARRAAR